MSRLTERSHRWLCRAGFVALCAAPTLFVVGWIAAARLPLQRLQWEQQLGARLNAKVKVTGVCYPEPGLTRLVGVSVCEPNSGQTLIETERLDLRRRGETWIAETMEITLAAGTQGLWPVVLRGALPAPGFDDAAWTLLAQRAVTRTASGETTLHRLSVQRVADGRIRASAVVADDGPLRMDLQGLADGSLHVELDATAAPLSSGIAALMLPATACLGKHAGFRGTLEGTLSSAGATATVQGELSGLDLETLTVGAVAPDVTLRGTGKMTLEQLQFRTGRIVSARGSFQAMGGTAGPSFVTAAGQALQLRGNPAANRQTMAAAGQPIAFEELAFDFTFDGKQLQLTGRCRNADLGGLLTSQDGRTPLLSTAGVMPQPPTALARMFSPVTADWVPATPVAQWLLARLPTADGPK